MIEAISLLAVGTLCVLATQGTMRSAGTQGSSHLLFYLPVAPLGQDRFLNLMTLSGDFSPIRTSFIYSPGATRCLAMRVYSGKG